MPETTTETTDLDEIIKQLQDSTPGEDASETLKGGLLSCVKNIYDFSRIYITVGEKSDKRLSVVSQALKEKLPALSLDLIGLNYFLNTISDQQCEDVCELLKEELPSLINTTPNLMRTLRSLVFTGKFKFNVPKRLAINTPKRLAVLKALEKQLPSIIKEPDDLASVFMEISYFKGTVLCEFLKGKLLTLNTCELRDLLKSLPAEKCGIVCEIPGTASIIENGFEFETVFKDLDSDKQAAVFQTLIKGVLSSIKAPLELITVLRLLTPEQCEFVLKALKTPLSSIIKTDLDLEALNDLAIEQKDVVIKELTNQGSSVVIKNDSDLEAVTPYLTDAQPDAQLKIVQEQKGSLPLNTTDNHDLENVPDLATEKNAQDKVLISTLVSLEKTIDKFAAKLKIDIQIEALGSNTEISSNKVLSKLKTFVNDAAWNEKGVSFFASKTPDGILKLRDVLVDTSLKDDLEKLNEVATIARKHCSTSSFFRKGITSDFYIDLFRNFLNYPAINSSETAKTHSMGIK